MTPTELWDIYYHAMKRWMSTARDEEIRKVVDILMDISAKQFIKYSEKKN